MVFVSYVFLLKLIEKDKIAPLFSEIYLVKS